MNLLLSARNWIPRYVSITIDFLCLTFCYSAEKLVCEQECLPLDQRYLRCVERHNIPSDDSFQLVICMMGQMSMLLVQAKRISIDTLFKRVRGWQEFEIEGWDNMHQRCKVFPPLDRMYLTEL